MSKPRLALAGGFNGSGGEPPKTALDRLIDEMNRVGKRKGLHPIFVLHYHENLFSGFPSIDLRVEACKKILQETQPESISNSHAGGVVMILEDFPKGYLVKAFEDLGVTDFSEWLKPRKMGHDVVRPQFGKREPT